MIAYTYDLQGYFTGVTVAQRNPKKIGAWLLPADSTFVEVPDSSTYTADEIPLFNEDTQTWALVDSLEKVDNDNKLLTVTNEYGILLYVEDENGKPVLRPQAEVDTETDAYIAERNLSEGLSDIKSTMDTNIILKAMEITKGTSVESVQAFMSAFQLRAANPAEYVNEGLQVYWPIDEYALLSSLDTEAKITGYYNKVLIYIDKFRQAEINTYVAAKAALEA